jgi:hypothetical protein
MREKVVAQDIRTTVGRLSCGIYSQDEFVSKFGGEEITDKLKTKDGANIVSGMYGNAKIMYVTCGPGVCQSVSARAESSITDSARDWI